ncbi:MAG: hypothetical protein R3F56_21855 [Planctomycetota bacterium]
MDSAPDRRSDSSRSPSPTSPEYRAKLLTKLNCLIAVLEVAITKITRSMDLPGANEDRLVKIRANLENTLAICARAKQTLEKSLSTAIAPPKPTPQLPGPVESGRPRMTYRDYVELTSITEYRKFKAMAPISPTELAAIDLDDLVKRLQNF